MRAKYTNVSIPKALANEIDKVLESEKMGFKSRAELTKHAIRRLLLKLK